MRPTLRALRYHRPVERELLLQGRREGRKKGEEVGSHRREEGEERRRLGEER